jgi:Subtilisin inhibitor-like
MRRILAISMAAAIPAVLPVHAVDARTKPAPRPGAGAHSRPVRSMQGAHSGHSSHGRPAHEPAEYAHGRPARNPENDVQVSTDDPGLEGAQGAPAGNEAPAGQQGRPSQGTPAGHQGTTAHRPQGQHAAPGTRGTRGRPAQRPRTRANAPSRPSTGGDTGFSIPSEADFGDDVALPPEAAAAIRELGPYLGEQGIGGANAGDTSGADNGGTADQNATDKNTNLTSNPAGARLGEPAASQLVLHTAAGASPARTVTLRCDPVGGTHPKAAQACAEIAKSNGDLQQLPAGTNPRACFMIYAPVTASAQGAWHGQNVRYSSQFPNTCVMRDKTGALFDF